MNNKGIFSIYQSNEIAKYIRLSLADENNEKDESESIANQRKILNEFIEKNGYDVSKSLEFVDDGCSGTNFNRPGWQNLMTAIDNGTIKVIITKNLSRLGRSNFECSYFLDYFFPTNHIRYIALQEQIDTFNQENSNNEYAALNNFINEKYSKDLSKNIKKVYKIKQHAGEYLASSPIYGYNKDPKNKHKLIIDEEAAKIVRKIYQLYLQTQSQNQIRKILSEEKVLIPEVYKKTRRGLKVKNPYEWNYRTIRDILRNEMYIGNMVQNVFSKKSFREKKLIKNKKEEWIIIENTQEAIIDKETFYKVQELLKVNYRKPIPKDPHIFSGLLYCHECGHRIGIGRIIRNAKTKQIYFYTYCNYYRKNSIYQKCSPHSSNYNNLEVQLLNFLEIKYQEIFTQFNYKKIIEDYQKKIPSNIEILKEKQNKIETNQKEIQLKLEKSYLDYLDDIISKTTYQKIKEQLERKRSLLIENKKSLEIQYQNWEKNRKVGKCFNYKQVIRAYWDKLKNHKREFLIQMIEKIEIHQDKIIDIYLK